MKRQSGGLWILGGAVIGLGALLAGAIMARAPKEQRPERVRIDDASQLVDVAWDFIESGSANRLPELIHPESLEMESVLARLGRLMGSLQELAMAVQSRFPDEVRATRDEMESAGGNILGRARQAARDGPDDRLLARIFADPFGWLTHARDRISVVYVADDVRAILVDGKPAFGIGLTLREYEDGWRIAVPTTVPGVSRYLPKNKEEWQIAASMVTVLDNTIQDLSSEVQSGRTRNLNDVARKAGEMAWIPIVMTAVAYQKAMEARDSNAAH